MTFVNPLEALGLDQADPLDLAAVMKARRRLLVEIELADGKVTVGSVQVERSDLIRVLQDIDDEEKARCYHALLKVPRLSAFLQEGDLTYFRVEESLPDGTGCDLISFISPWFSARYGAALAAAVCDHNALLVQRLAARPPLVTPTDLRIADHPVDALLTRTKEELESILAAVKAEDLDADDALTQSRLLVSTEVLNALPSRFDTARSQVARLLRNIGVIAFNVQDAAKAAYTLLSDAARLHTSPGVRDDIRRQLEAVKAARDEELLFERHADDVTRCTKTLEALHALSTDLVRGAVEPADAVARARVLVLPNELEAIPEELGEVVAQIAFALRGLSVTFWNEHANGEAANALLRHALLLRVPFEVRQQLLEDKATLDQAVRDRDEHLDDDKDGLKSLAQMLRSMMDAIAQHRGDQVRWTLVAERLTALLSSDLVMWLRQMRPVAPGLVHDTMVAFAAPLAGLARFHPTGYERILERLQPLTADDPPLAGILSRAAVEQHAVQDPRIRRATRGPAVWEQAWFWWVVIISLLILLGQLS